MRSFLLPFSLFICGRTAFHIEIIAEPRAETCVTEVFNKNEPTSISIRLTEPTLKPRKPLVLSVQNDKNTHAETKEYDPDLPVTKLAYNTFADTNVHICVKNKNPQAIEVEIRVKRSHHLGNVEKSPTQLDYTKIDDLIDDVMLNTQISYNYFRQNEELCRQNVAKSAKHERKSVTISAVTLLVMAGLGIAQILLVRNDLKKKKNL